MNTLPVRDQLEQRLEDFSRRGLGYRRQALERFLELGWPGRKLEAWHYTDLSSFDDRVLALSAPVPEPATLRRIEASLGNLSICKSGSRTVFIDGELIPGLSTDPAAGGIAIRKAAGEPDRGPAPTALTALSNAIAESGTEILINGQNSEPHELIFVGSGRAVASQMRLVISAAPASEAQLMFRFADVDDTADAWLNLNVEILQQVQSRLALYRLQTHGASGDQTILHRAILEQDARLVAHNVEAGGRLIRNEYEIELTGPGASAEINAVAVTSGEEHCDIRIAVDHQAPRTLSRQNHRAILSGASRGVFNGKVTVREQAQQIDARQRSDNLLLSPGAEADTKPELEIYADQVVCSHGATVGELDDDHLFYLRARGIDEVTARGILTAAFADTVLELAASREFTHSAREAVRARLPRSTEPQ